MSKFSGASAGRRPNQLGIDPSPEIAAEKIRKLGLAGGCVKGSCLERGRISLSSQKRAQRLEQRGQTQR